MGEMCMGSALTLEMAQELSLNPSPPRLSNRDEASMESGVLASTAAAVFFCMGVEAAPPMKFIVMLRLEATSASVSAKSMLRPCNPEGRVIYT